MKYGVDCAFSNSHIVGGSGIQGVEIWPILGQWTRGLPSLPFDRWLSASHGHDKTGSVAHSLFAVMRGICS